jgi:hypothetical protein
MDKALARILFSILILAAVLAFTLALSPFAAQASHTHPSDSLARPAASRQPARATLTPTLPPTPTPEPVSQPGSTDGIVVMSFAIVVIIILPILMQRSLWTR